MDPVISALLLEGAKLALHSYLTHMKLAGKTEEEIDTAFQAELLKFKQNRPEDLPDV